MSSPQETFQLECNDLLADMEEALLVLESDTDDFDQVNAIFRAMHTIKGTSGVFGYDDIVSFTHVAESVLDKVRANEVDINSELVAVFLESMDHTKILIDSAIFEKEISQEDKDNESQLLTRLNVFLGIEETVEEIEPIIETQEEEAVEAEKNADTSNEQQTEKMQNSTGNSLLSYFSKFIENLNNKLSANKADSNNSSNNVSFRATENEDINDEAETSTNNENIKSPYWHLSIRFDKEVLENGMDPLSFFIYLNKIGKIIHLSTLHDEFLLDDSFNPESNYLGFEVVYECSEDKDKIEQTFEFVSDMCTLHILPAETSMQSYADLINILPENNAHLCEIFRTSLALTEDEIEKILTLPVEAPEPLEQEPNTETQADNVEDKPVEITAVESKPETTKAKNTTSDTKEKTKPIAKSQSVIRVDAEKLDSLINLVGELVIAGATTNMVASQIGDEKLLESMAGISHLVEEIRDNALNLRMVQVGETFSRFKRVVRDVSKDLGKDIKLTIIGAETELDKTVIDKIGDPLMHLVRNSMDHGIESAEERRESGKDMQGNLTLNAYHDAGYIVIEVKDDGKGLNKERILAKALEKDLITENQVLTDEEIYQLVFAPGFSTAETITNLSGRGVGMDVVSKNIEALRGTVEITSTPGEGSTVSIRLPLTLAIIDGFLVKVGDSSYVIPLDMVHECIDLSEDEKDDSSQGYINLRGEVLPFLQLRDYFKEDGAPSAHKSIVVVRQGNRKAGFVVDELLGELQTVIKPMGKILKNLRGISGATILGSGEVAVILDVPNLIQRATKNVTHVERGSSQSQSSMTLH